jgi:hypothetical protein
MKIFLTTILIYSCIVLSTFASDSRQIGTITFILGGKNDVLIKHHNSQQWNAAKLKMTVLNDDVLQTKKESRCEVKLGDGSLVRIGENSIFEFATAPGQIQKDVRAELKKGRAWANLAPFKSQNKQFQIKAPTAVCAVRGTIYRVDADSLTRCSVYDGQVDVGPVSLWGMTQQQQQESKSLQPVEVPGPTEIPPPYQVSLEQWIQIVQGFQIIVRPDGKYAKSKIDLQADSQDEWVKWNQEFDSKVRR